MTVTGAGTEPLRTLSVLPAVHRPYTVPVHLPYTKQYRQTTDTVHLPYTNRLLPAVHHRGCCPSYRLWTTDSCDRLVHLR